MTKRNFFNLKFAALGLHYKEEIFLNDMEILMNRKLQIRNSTAEFLTFASQNEANSIEVRFEDETLWLTQQLIAELFLQHKILLKTYL